MGRALIIVESPAKIKTLKKFLGADFEFESSVGHIRDLPQKGFGIDVEHNFEPQYEILPDKTEVVERLIKAAKKCDIVYLSPDPDREGEAIAWHIASILPKGTKIKRTAFNSITKEEVLKAIGHPEDIDVALVNAQQARRLLDRIVGYKISPLLARRVKKGRSNGGVSAGRVQSVALKMVVDREKEIAAFKPVEYWSIHGVFHKERDTHKFGALLFSVDGKKIEKELIEGKEVFLIPNKATADSITHRLEKAQYHVERVERKEKRRNPVPPFITSTLQQEASRHFGFSPARTMNIAQGLYEGIDMGAEGSEGLITYMRTDSVRIAPEALAEVRNLIAKQYGPEYLPEQARIYSSKKAAQDAHEAIRPTNLKHPPENISKFLTRDQFQLYSLIWKRFIASQMNPAVYDTISADISTKTGLLFRATGSTLKFPGFLAVYEERKDEKDEEDEESRSLPHLEEGQKLLLADLKPEQSFTRPPPRFTEASLVKELEKSGIGRPSTYATIMNKIQSREYTIKETGRLKPTELGQVIAQMLETSFPQIMNIGFTAAMEDDLERIAENQMDWKTLIKEFWDQFIPTVELAEKEAFVPKIETDISCPKCGKKLQKIWSRNKYFYGCSGYPECDYSAPLEELTFNKDDYDPNFDWDQSCPKCSSPMKVRHGRFGAFLGCTKYPDCKGIVNIPKKGETPLSQENMPACPAIDCPGTMVARRSRFGKIFYSCSTYPDCDVIINDLIKLSEKYPSHPRTPYVKKKKMGKRGAAAKTAIKSGEKKATKAKAPKKSTTKTTKKPRQVAEQELSPLLAEIVGAKKMARTKVTKKLWDYIKSHQLQDPKNKRLIIPDAKLAKLFGSDAPLDMFQLSGVLSKHFKK
jgi:DNA topoisomerase-1